MLVVGLTGGIGSGKSTIAKVFEKLGIPVFNSDIVSKKLMQENKSLIQQIIDNFGAEVYLDNHVLNRQKLASIVFNDPDKLKLLNQLVHPQTILAFQNWKNSLQCAYCIKESALIFETDVLKEVDKVIGIYTPKNLRIQRIKQRDKISIEEINKRMLQQIDDNIKMKLCDFVIYNDDSQLIVKQVLDIHKKFLVFSF